MKKYLQAFFTSIMIVCAASLATPAYAANDALLELMKILRDKGSITQDEYELLVNAAKTEEEKVETVKQEVKEEVKKDVEKQVAEATKELPTITTKDKIEIVSGDGNFVWKPTGRVLVDWNEINSDTDGAELGSGWELRRARLGMEVTLWKHWLGKVEVDFAATNELISVKDAFVGYKNKTGYGDWWVKLGQQHIPFGWETMSSSNYMTFMERSAYADGPLQIARHIGASAFTRAESGRWTLHAGVFGGPANEDPDSCTAVDGECDEQWNIAGRATGIPFMQDETHLLHLGAGVWYRNPLGSSIKLEQRQGVFHVVDSKPWSLDFAETADDIFAFSFETVGIYGPAHIKAEYVAWNVDVEPGSAFTDDVDLNGWSVEAGWFLTGESKVYDLKKAQFGGLKPKGIVGHGGIGAWEVGIRFDTLDLNDPDAGAIGGEGDLLTLGLNWYVNNTMRLMANYKQVLDFECTGGAGDCLRLDGDESSAFLLRGQIYW